MMSDVSGAKQKTGGVTWRPVDDERVERFMDAVDGR
jgi:predicted TIM-barrel enzyme